MADDVEERSYFDLLSRGGLTVPSSPMAEFVCASFAILDYTDKFISKDINSTTQSAAQIILKLYTPKSVFTCEDHIDRGLKFAARLLILFITTNRIILRIFFQGIALVI